MTNRDVRVTIDRLVLHYGDGTKADVRARTSSAVARAIARTGEITERAAADIGASVARILDRRIPRHPMTGGAPLRYGGSDDV